MATATDPYVPTEKHPAPFNIGTASISSGSGSPEGAVIGSPGDAYVDSAGGVIYVKETGTGTTGWVASSGGSGSGSVLAANYGGIAPNVTPSGPTWAQDTSSGEMWFYTVASGWKDTGIQVPI